MGLSLERQSVTTHVGPDDHNASDWSTSKYQHEGLLEGWIVQGIQYGPFMLYASYSIESD